MNGAPGSDRSSGRVVESPTNSQINTSAAAISGADGKDMLAASKAARVGHKDLAERRSSLGDRDWAILHSLGELSYLSTRQVERLHYPADQFTPLSAARSSRHDLSRLHRLQLIRHLDRRIGGLRAGSASFVWTLDSLGARALHHSTRRRAQEPSRLHLDHVLDVAELVVRLHETSRGDGHCEIIEVQGEPTCWRVIPSDRAGKLTLTLKPDLRLTLGVDDRELHWFVEIDRGSEHRPVLARKCAAYVTTWRHGAEQTEHDVFPRVLWVVPDEARAAVIESVIQGLAEAPIGMFLTTTDERAVRSLLGEAEGPEVEAAGGAS